MKKNIKYTLGVFVTAAMLCSLSGCTGDDAGQQEEIMEIQEEIIDAEEFHEDGQGVNDEEMQGDEQSVSTEEVQRDGQSINDGQVQAGEDLDVITASPDDDEWYMRGTIYTDDKGRRLEVFFNDEGTLEFAIDGLSVHITTTSNFQQENNWKVYTCDDGVMVVYRPGDPATVEITEGDYEGIYTAGGDKVK